MQNLTILIEDTTHTSDELVYIPDTEDSGYGDQLKVSGWRIANWDIAGLLRSYDSQFGAGSEDSTGERVFAALRYQLTIDRSFSFFLWKLLLPLAVVLGMALAALVVHPNQADLRMALPTTGLLTMVFLQQSYTASLPDIGKLVLMDQVYVLGYMVIIAVLVTVMWGAHKRESETGDAAAMRRMDLIVLAVTTTLMIVGTVLLILLG